MTLLCNCYFFFFQAEDGIRDSSVTGVQTCALPISGDPHAALTLADDALSDWTADGASDSAAVPSAGLAMRQAKAAALFACGNLLDAVQLQQQTLAAMRSESGDWQREVILLNRMAGVRHRMTGDFRAAQLADQESVDEHLTELGEDHPHTFPVLSAVITDLALTSDD